MNVQISAPRAMNVSTVLAIFASPKFPVVTWWLPVWKWPSQRGITCIDEKNQGCLRAKDYDDAYAGKFVRLQTVSP